MRRLLRWSLLAAALLCVTLAAAAWTLVNTSTGLRWSAALAQHLSGGTLQLGAVNGRLGDEFAVDGLRYAGADGLLVEARRVELRLRLPELLAGRLHLERALAAGLRVRLAPPAARPSATPHLPTRLPLDLLVERLSLDGLQVDQGARGGPDRRVVALGATRLAGSWIGTRLDIGQLDTALADTGPLRLRARLDFAADQVDIAELELSGPGELQAHGWLGVYGAARSDLQIQWRGLQWPLVAAQPWLAGATGTARLQGTLDAYRFELHGAGAARQLALQVDAQGSGDRHGLHLAQARLGSGSGSLSAQGSLGWEPGFTADLHGQLDKLDPALLAPDWNGALSGEFDTHTRLEPSGTSSVFTLALQRSTLRGHPLALTAQGSTDFRALQLSRFDLQSGSGHVRGSGALAWSPALQINASAQIERLDPAQFLPRWNGQLNGRLQADTRERDGRKLIAFTLQFDRSQLRGYPLQLAAQGELRGARELWLENFNLASGSTRLVLAGQVTPPFALAGRLQSSGLESLHPDLTGRGSLDFKLDGPLATPHLVARGQFDDLRLRRYRIASLKLDADLDPRRPSHLQLAASDAWAGLAIRQFVIAAQGDLAYQHAELHADTERGSVAVAVDGGYDRKRREWGGQLSQLHLAPAELPDWTLEHPAGLLFGQRRQSLEPACLAGGSGRACLRLEQNVKGRGLRLSWQLDRLLLATLAPLLPQHTALQGEVLGSGSIEVVDRDVAAMDGTLRTQDVQLQQGTAPPLVLLPSSLTATDTDNRLRLLLDLRAPQGSLRADLAAAPGADFASRPLSGILQVDVPDLAFVSLLNPELEHAGGRVGGSLQLGGSLGLPAISGTLVLDDGHARLVTPSIDVDKVHVSLSGQGNGPLQLAGSLESGGGSLSIDGTLDPAVAPPTADLHLQGKDFQAMATPDAHIWVTPDLHLAAQGGSVQVDGSFDVPKAQITPNGFGDNGVTVSRDQVIVGDEEPPAATAIKISGTVQMQLGDAVSFNGFGLSTHMTGSVALTEQPQKETLAQGQISLVNGRYKAYGQDLQIETGRLIFNGGPVTEPAVDIYATRRPQSDVTVGVHVRGTLAKPELTLDSDPPMARQQQLSWLLLGRALDQTSSSESSMLSDAALSLGLTGGGYFGQKLGKGIGLDQVSVGSAPAFGSNVTANPAAIQGSQAALLGPTSPTTQAAQLTLGKYLTPRLFLSYGVSLFQPGQTVRLLYDLGKGFKLQTESGTESGGDVLYTVERGH